VNKLISKISNFFNYFSSKPATFNLEKARDFVQKNWTCDITKAKNDFGYSQNISLEEGVFVNAFVAPGVPPGSQMMRTSYMATHEEKHLQIIIDTFKKVGKEVGLI